MVKGKDNELILNGATMRAAVEAWLAEHLMPTSRNVRVTRVTQMAGGKFRVVVEERPDKPAK